LSRLHEQDSAALAGVWFGTLPALAALVLELVDVRHFRFAPRRVCWRRMGARFAEAMVDPEEEQLWAVSADSA